MAHYVLGLDPDIPVTVAPYDSGMWAANALMGEDGRLNIFFNGDFSLLSGEGCVAIGDKTYDAAFSGRILAVEADYEDLPGGARAVVSGVTTPLFPSYVFNFKVTVRK